MFGLPHKLNNQTPYGKYEYRVNVLWTPLLKYINNVSFSHLYAG